MIYNTVICNTVISWIRIPFYFFLGATAQVGPRTSQCLGFQITHTVGLLWTSYQLVTMAATYTTNTTDEHPCTQRDSNPRPQQASVRRPRPKTAWPPESTFHVKLNLIAICQQGCKANGFLYNVLLLLWCYWRMKYRNRDRLMMMSRSMRLRVQQNPPFSPLPLPTPFSLPLWSCRY